MDQQYKIVYMGGSDEIVEKKSRFIATVEPVETEEEALAFIERMRKQYWDARHNCYAYVLGSRNETCRCSDDGEPAQTAGRPMLDVLLGTGVHNVVVVVTRYFGGTLLGTGGLVRAYSKAVQVGLEASMVVTKEPCYKVSVSSDYNALGKIQYIAGNMNLKLLDSIYADNVCTVWLVPMADKDGFLKKVTEATSAQAKVEVSDICYAAFADKEVILF